MKSSEPMSGCSGLSNGGSGANQMSGLADRSGGVAKALGEAEAGDGEALGVLDIEGEVVGPEQAARTTARSTSA